MIKLIVAVDRDNAIGHEDGRLPWKISADMKRFKALTTGSAVVMGRKTFDSLGRPEGLPNRKNIVLSNSKTKDDNTENVRYIDSSGLLFAAWHALKEGDLWVIGGAQVYDQVLGGDVVDELYITTVELNSEAPVRINSDLYDYPSFVTREKEKGRQWAITEEEHHRDEEIPFSFITLKRQR